MRLRKVPLRGGITSSVGLAPECEMGGHDINAAREGNLVHVVQNRMHRLQLVATFGDALPPLL